MPPRRGVCAAAGEAPKAWAATVPPSSPRKLRRRISNSKTRACLASLLIPRSSHRACFVDSARLPQGCLSDAAMATGVKAHLCCVVAEPFVERANSQGENNDPPADDRGKQADRRAAQGHPGGDRRQARRGARAV